VELDVHACRSGELIVHHDFLVHGLGPIADLTLQDLRRARLSNGETIPTLDESLEAMLSPKPSIGEVWIELKSLPASSDTTLLEAIDRSPLPDRCAVHSFDHRIVARLGARRPGLRRGVLSTSYPVDPVSPMVATGSSALWQEWRLIDSSLVDAVHRAGGEIIAWTVNDPERARALERLGVDAVCGNWPDRLRSG
jgi:glycerophosphoryl diester phosphodiesterase